MKVEGVVRRLVEQVGRLDELRPERVEGHLRLPQLPVEALRQRAVLAPDGEEEHVRADRLLDVAVQHLQHARHSVLRRRVDT